MYVKSIVRDIEREQYVLPKYVEVCREGRKDMKLTTSSRQAKHHRDGVHIIRRYIAVECKPPRWMIGQENLIALALSTSLRPRTMIRGGQRAAPMN